MKKIKKITATKARNDFFNIVQDAYLSNNNYLIEKNGIPMAYILPIKSDLLIDKGNNKKDVKHSHLNKKYSPEQIKQFKLLERLEELRKLQKPSEENSVDLIRKMREERMNKFVK